MEADKYLKLIDEELSRLQIMLMNIALEPIMPLRRPISI